MILEATNIVKVYGGKYGVASMKALDGISLSLKMGEFVGIMGPSGSGKSTLLKILGGMDYPTSGKVRIENKTIDCLKKRELSLLRRQKLGFVFQNYNLLDSLTVLENIMLPLVIDKKEHDCIDSKARHEAKKLGILNIINKYPFQISGGQKQRTAIARAIVNEPAIVMADEPTGNLDSKASIEVMQSFKTISKTHNKTTLMVSHDPFATSFCDRVIFLHDGKITLEINKEGNNNSFFERILSCQEIVRKKVVIGDAYNED